MGDQILKPDAALLEAAKSVEESNSKTQLYPEARQQEQRVPQQQLPQKQSHHKSNLSGVSAENNSTIIVKGHVRSVVQSSSLKGNLSSYSSDHQAKGVHAEKGSRIEAASIDSQVKTNNDDNNPDLEFEPFKINSGVEDKRVYDLKTPGNVPIINISFKRSKNSKQAAIYAQYERSGSEKDVKDTRKFFEDKLGCLVTVQEDVESVELKGVLDKFKKKCIKEDSSFCAVIFMSHGGREKLSLVMDDLEEVDFYLDLVYPFQEDQFEDFHGKPKLFFIQACADYGTGGTNADSLGSTRPQSVQIDVDTLRTKVKVGKVEDAFLGLACMPYQVSWRSVAQGAWYIQAILKIFASKWQNEDLATMHDQVTDEILGKGKAADHDELQTPFYIPLKFGCFKFPNINTPK